jgi:PAS domain S-box-containing protein
MWLAGSLTSMWAAHQTRRFDADLRSIAPDHVLFFGVLVSLLLGALVGVLLVLVRYWRAGLQTQELLAGIAATSTDSIIVESLQGVVMSWNAEAERVFGYTAGEAVGSRVVDLLLPPERAHEDAELLASGASGRRVTPFDTMRRRRDGSLVDVSIAAVAIIGPDGRVSAVAKTIRDISHRKAAERALKVSNAHLEEQVNRSSGQLETVKRDLSNILDVLPSMIGYWDKNLVNRMANRAFSRWFDLDPAWLPGTPLRNLPADILLTPDLAAIEAALRGETVTFERTLPGRRGAGAGHVLLQFVPDILEGEVLGFYMLGHDITAYKEAQRRLIESEKFLQRAETVSRVGGFMIDLASAEQRWTRQTFRIFEVDEDCVPNSEMMKAFLTPEVRELLDEKTRIARDSGTGYDIEIPIRTAKNRPIWIRVAGEVESEEGVAARIVGAIQDITERRKLEQQLRDAISVADKASKSKSEFLANMSHEIRTPLNAVIGLGYLLEQTSLSEDQRQFLAKIQFAGRSLLGVINNVLDLSKIEAGEMPLEDEPFDLVELVRDVSQMLQPQALAKGIDLIVQPAPALPRMIRGDASRMRQILTNLLNNSIKFTESGHVSLRLFCTEQGSGRIRLRCEVSDTGIGIEPSACDRLFTPFSQADASTTRRFGGTGLGLSIARRFVELMGGEIGVTSALGVGSTFWIEIPFRVAPDVDGTLTISGLHVLIVDSSGDTPQGTGAMVRALGWNPRVVESGEQMLATMNNTPPDARFDAIILDLHLRDMDAHRLIERLRQSCPYGEAPSVIVVADSPESYLEHKALMRPEDGLLVRPVTSSALFNAINLAVSRQPDSHERIFESTNFDELHAEWLSGVRVLVVDDSDINLEVAQRILEKQGALVATCSNGESALAYVRDHHQELDLVLMDVQMPILDGNEATRRIRHELKLPALPVVALTAGALVGERQRSLEAGMNDFVSKPFDPQALIRKVRRLAEIARGEPIPMVFEEKGSSGMKTGRPLMKSIDAAVVQQMFGDDLSLFKSLLSRLLRDYADLALPVAVLPGDASAADELKRRAHKLKGSAGMIGATHIMRFAGSAERALQEARSVDSIDAILKKLAAALTTLREESEPFFARWENEASAAVPTSCADISPQEIDLLCGLFERQDLAAMDKFNLMAAPLAQWLGAARFTRLHDAVDILDFSLCSELLREAVDYPPVLAAAR